MKAFYPNNLTYQKPNYALKFVSNAVFLVLVILSLFLFWFGFTYISTPVIGTSMQPTLNVKGENKSDIVYVNRFSGFTYGDIVVIHKEDETNKNIIKRVIALGGDTVALQFNNGTGQVELFVNNALQTETYIYGYPDQTGMATTLTNFELLKDTQPTLFNTEGALVVPNNTVFVLGDHREVSADSSVDGPYAMESVVGRVDYIVPYGQNELVYFLNLFTPFHFAT